MRERLDFRKLRYVVAVAEEKSFTAAAQLLSISQPALTRCISEVEDDLGTQLFHRLARGVSVTDEGEEFVQRAKTLLADLKALGQDFRHGTGQVRGHLRLGVTPGPFLSVAASAVAEFAADHPEIDIVTTAGRPGEIVPRLETGELDVVLSTTAYMKQWPENPIENVAPLEFSYMIRKGHPVEHQAGMTADDILNYPAILPATSDWMHRDLAALHERLRLPPAKATYLTDDFTLVFSLLNRTNAYYPLVSVKSTLEELGKQFSMMPVSRAISNQHLVLAFAKTRASSPLVKILAPILRQMLSE